MDNMTEQEQQLQQVGLDIDEAKAHIALAEALDRLHKNADFKAVILKEYLIEESVRIVGLKSDPNALDEEKQTQIDNVIISIGGLRQYFGKIYHMGRGSQQAIDEYRGTQAELLQEQLDGESLQ